MKISTRMLCLCALFTALTAIGAFISIPIPMYPVPFTLQTFFVFLAGIVLPPRGALLSIGAYVLLGLVGLPIFTGGGGIGYIFQPTFGYLLAFVIGAYFLSVIYHGKLSSGKRFTLAMAVIFGMSLLGVFYMMLVSGFYLGTPIPFDRAVYLFYIFIPLDTIKLALSIPLAKRIAPIAA